VSRREPTPPPEPVKPEKVKAPPAGRETTPGMDPGSATQRAEEGHHRGK
jgi:hypothetical protein